MKLIAIVFLASLSVAVCAEGSGVPSMSPPTKPHPGPMPPAGHLQGGDTIETAVLIEDLPYYTTGTTAGYINDYDEACPYGGSLSPDVVYEWIADFTGPVDILLCESDYDTKVYVYENEYTPGMPHACNDDNGNCPGPPYRSWIEFMEVTEGNIYYVVVDGYGNDFGDYQFAMYETPFAVECEPECPPGAFDEGEPDCYDGYVDETNSGCQTPGGWSQIELNTFVCGTSGNYNDNTYRDMDWYEFTVDEDTSVDITLCADFPVRFWLLDGTDGCADPPMVLTDAIVANYELVSYADLWPGIWWFAVSVDGWLDVPCGSAYVAGIFEYGYTPVLETSWGAVKALYR